MIRNPKIKYLISTTKNYYKKTLNIILPSIINQINNKNIIICISNCQEKIKISDIETFCVHYNSYEYTGIINLSEIEYQDCDYIFLLHDTMICGDRFYYLSRQFYHDNFIMAHPKGWCNLGVYKINYLISEKIKLINLKNISKLKAIQLEGNFLGHNYSTYKKAGCKLLNEYFAYDKIERNLSYFESVDVYKYGSNDTNSFRKGQIIDQL